MDLESKYPLHGETYKNRKVKDCDCQKVILESSYGNFGPLDVTFVDDDGIPTFNQAIASVTVDLSCINCANILLDFTGILNVTTTISASGALTFTLFKTCRRQMTRQPLTTFTFFVADIFGGEMTSHTLAFKYPSRNDNCQDCCTYTLELNSISNLGPGTITYSINGTLSALVVENPC
jgi:hypothetical protein